MERLDYSGLKQTVRRQLRAASYKPGTLMLLHAGVALGVSFLITLLNFILARQIDNTSGLSGVQTRTVLETVRTVLQYGGSVALPFWEIGIVYAALRWARGGTALPADLTEGFRRFGPVLRKMLLEGALFFVIGMGCVYLSTGIYMMTPFAQPLMEIMLPLMENTSVLSQQIVMDEAVMAAAMEAMTPVFVIFAVVFCVVCVPLLYRLRMTDFALMDDDCPGALAALLKSWKLTRGNVLQLVRVDLRFWWFYGLQMLFTAVSFGDVLLPRLGISLPIAEETAYFGFYIVNILCQLALFRWAGSRVQTTYALIYDVLRQNPQAQAARPAPKQQPWEY